MDSSFREALQGGARAMGLLLPPGAAELLERYADRLLAWNRRVNLTAITAPAEVAEKHLLDSLALGEALRGARSLLDVGSGAGLPGVPLACVHPGLEVVCCDSVARKVAFVKVVAAELGLERLRGVVARAGGRPAEEGLPLAEVVVSRALSDPELWVPLGRAYLAPGGALLAMLGRQVEEARLRALGAEVGLELESVSRYELPLSRSSRAIARWSVAR